VLVLKRKLSEKIIITCGGETIEIMLVEILGRKAARLGIKAPDSVSVHREEVYKRLHDSGESLTKRRDAV
jgi:carbon storage regulator